MQSPAAFFNLRHLGHGLATRQRRPAGCGEQRWVCFSKPWAASAAGREPPCPRTALRPTRTRRAPRSGLAVFLF
jgi:hypothetical protein